MNEGGRKGKLNCRGKCPFSCYEEAYHAVQIDGGGLKQLFMERERELVARARAIQSVLSLLPCGVLSGSRGHYQDAESAC